MFLSSHQEVTTWGITCRLFADLQNTMQIHVFFNKYVFIFGLEEEIKSSVQSWVRLQVCFDFESKVESKSCDWSPHLWQTSSDDQMFAERGFKSLFCLYSDVPNHKLWFSSCVIMSKSKLRVSWASSSAEAASSMKKKVSKDDETSKPIYFSFSLVFVSRSQMNLHLQHISLLQTRWLKHRLVWTAGSMK